MPMFLRTKPMLVEAFEITEACIHGEAFECPDWLEKALMIPSGVVGSLYFGPDSAVLVTTYRYTQPINVGDYIIKGPKGIIYMCSADEFKAAYELVVD